jgi:hypothetical protein
MDRLGREDLPGRRSRRAENRNQPSYRELTWRKSGCFALMSSRPDILLAWDQTPEARQSLFSIIVVLSTLSFSANVGPGWAMFSG